MDLKRRDQKLVCTACDVQMLTSEIDRVADPHPLPNTKPDVWSVCPNCRTPENFKTVCDAPGCTLEASCGTPTYEGYRWTCHNHRPDRTK
jgi:hypothetical protein